jgi:hypothetical protein
MDPAYGRRPEYTSDVDHSVLLGNMGIAGGGVNAFGANRMSRVLPTRHCCSTSYPDIFPLPGPSGPLWKTTIRQPLLQRTPGALTGGKTVLNMLQPSEIMYGEKATKRMILDTPGCPSLIQGQDASWLNLFDEMFKGTLPVSLHGA